MQMTSNKARIMTMIDMAHKSHANTRWLRIARGVKSSSFEEPFLCLKGGTRRMRRWRVKTSKAVAARTIIDGTVGMMKEYAASIAFAIGERVADQ